MSDTWDAEEFDVDKGFESGALASDRWDGEDEEDVKDNWEDEDEEEEKKDDDNKEDPNKEANADKAYQRKKKKLADRIAEKQAAKQKELDLEPPKKLTPEEELAEKLKRQKLQEESDLQLAKDAFGVHDGVAGAGIDGMFPDSQDDFIKFGDALKNKITQFEKSPCFVPFLEKLFTDLIVSLEHEDVKKLSSAVTNIYQEKLKQHKEAQKKNKKKNKISIKSERDSDFGDLAAASSSNYGDYYDDDFI